MISKAIESNPREIKRFLNNFIVAHEIFSNTKDFISKELLVLQVIQLRWNNIYNLLIKADKQFLNELNRYSKLNDAKRIKILEANKSKEGQDDYDNQIRKTLNGFKLDSELWIFLNENIETLNNIKDWNMYRRATEIGIDHFKSKDIHEESIELLKSFKIYLFNKKRSNNELFGVDLQYANLRGVDLRGANFRGVDLRGAILDSAVLEDVYLNDANLEEASLEDTNLKRAFLINTNLKGTNLANSNLRDANLDKANLDKANLDSAKIIKTSLNESSIKAANLSNTIIINPENYDKMELDGYTKFIDAIIDDQSFLDHISRYTKHIPKVKIENKEQLRKKLKEKKTLEWKINAYLEYSKLPEDSQQNL